MGGDIVNRKYLVHVMKMMLTRSMALRAKRYKVMQHLYWHPMFS